MSWIDIFEATGIRSCSARGSASSTTISSSSGNITLTNGAKMTKITLDVWASNSDTTLYTFSNGGIKIGESGDYLVSASLYYNGGITNDNHGIHVVDSNNNELMSAHYYNMTGLAGGGCGIAPKIITITANTILYLCGHTNISSASPTVTPTNAATFLTIVKL